MRIPIASGTGFTGAAKRDRSNFDRQRAMALLAAGLGVEAASI